MKTLFCWLRLRFCGPWWHRWDRNEVGVLRVCRRCGRRQVLAVGWPAQLLWQDEAAHRHDQTRLQAALADADLEAIWEERSIRE